MAKVMINKLSDNDISVFNTNNWSLWVKEIYCFGCKHDSNELSYFVDSDSNIDTVDNNTYEFPANFTFSKNKINSMFNINPLLKNTLDFHE